MKIKNRKFIACACAVALVAGVVPYYHDVAENISINASAEETTVLGADQLVYEVCGDYVHIICVNVNVSGAIEFPSEIDELPVRVIGGGKYSNGSTLNVLYDNIYYNSRNVTYVKIPDTVTTIMEKAFYNTTSLETVEIPSSVTEIGDLAFAGCSALKKLYIPEDGANMTIGKGAFVGCAKLTELNLPNRVTSVGGGCFAGCTNLQYVTLSENMTQLHDCSLDSALSLDDVNYGAEFGFFEKCPSIKKIVLPDMIASVDDRAFTGCTSLENITIGSGVTDLTGIDFDMETLKEIHVSENNTMYSSDDNGVLLNREGTELLRYPKASELVEYTVPGTVNKIKASAFSGAFNIKSVILPESVNKINLESFYDCERLEKVTIENPDCDIANSENTLGSETTIYGYTGSTAQAYAEKYNRVFVALDEPTEPSTEPTEPATDPTEPTEPVTDPTEPSTDPTEPETDPTEPATLIGDITGDGTVNLYDVIEIAKYMLGMRDFTDEAAIIADYNSDGTVNLYDAIAIAQYMMGN